MLISCVNVGIIDQICANYLIGLLRTREANSTERFQLGLNMYRLQHGVFFTKSSKRHEPNFSGEPKNLFLRVISLLIDI